MTQRATSKRARRGYGRDKRGPPAQEEGEEGFSARRPNGPGVGTAATSAALPLEKNRDKGVNGEWAAFWRLA